VVDLCVPIGSCFSDSVLIGYASAYLSDEKGWFTDHNMAASSSTPVGSTVNKKLATQVSGPSLGASIGPPNSKKKKKSKANVKGLLKAPVCLDETWWVLSY